MRRETLPRLDGRLPLGASGLRVSPFALGMVRDPRAVLTAFDLGVNFFFVSADMHWPLYEGLREGLRTLFARRPRVRSRVVVGVVSYVAQPEFCWMPFDEVVDAIPGLEYIDLRIAGGAYGHEFPARLETYREILRDGHLGARAIGATFHDRAAAARALRARQVDTAFIRYNPAHPGARQDVFPRLPRTRTTLLYSFKSLGDVMTPERLDELGIERDYWRPRPTDYYRFALTRQALDGVLCSPNTPAEVQALAAAMEAGPLSPDEEAYLIDLADLDAGRTRLRAGET